MLIVAVIVIVGIVLCNTFDMWNHDVLYTLGGCLWMIGGIALIIIAIAWPSNYYEYKQKIVVYQATKQTIDESRKGGISDVERAALTNKIIEINQELASAKWTKQHFFGDTIPQEYADLPYLK
jgi:hypothetical protein